MERIERESTITCPNCHSVRRETMPEDACQWLYNCIECDEQLRPEPGDCCVFCSFGDVPCPPVQAEAGAPSVPAE